MAQPKQIFAIGDPQGCLGSLQQLLAKIQYDPQKMTLWFAGDLVNRGPQSLETLRFIHQLPSDTITVLGNHDLSLLRWVEQRELPDPTHKLYPILIAPDRDELMHWLRHQPLLHYDPQLQFTLTHAGIYPTWTLAQAMQYAQEVETVLQGSDYRTLLNHLYGNEPDTWDEHLTGIPRLRFMINAFARMRFCKKSAASHPRLDMHASGPPEQHPDLIPWFAMPDRPLQNTDLLFGHWSALEANQKCTTPHVFPLDSGCVWGNALTAFCLNTREYTSIPCQPG